MRKKEVLPRIRRTQDEIQNEWNPIEESEDEMCFEDDPVAIEEKDHQRYFHKPRTTFSNGSSELGEIMSQTVYNSRRIKAKDKYEKIKGENI